MRNLSLRYWLLFPPVGLVVLIFLTLCLQISRESVTVKGNDRSVLSQQKKEPIKERGSVQQALLRSNDQDESIQTLEREMAQVAQQSDLEKRRDELIRLCSKLASADPKRAMLLARQYGLDHGAGAVMENIVQTWAEKDLGAACVWIGAQPAGAVHNECCEKIAFVWSQVNPVDAAEFVIQKMSPGDAQTEAAMTVIHQWALCNMTAVTAWVQLFPEGDLRNRAIKELKTIASYPR